MSDFPPLYLYQDQAGRDYTLESLDLEHPSNGKGKGLRKKFLDNDDQAFLARTKVRIRYLPDLPLEEGTNPKTVETCNVATIPTSFTLVGSGYNYYGSIGVCSTKIKPINAHTQWLQFVVASSNFIGNQYHIAVPAWFSHTVRGHGVYFGHTASPPCSNGASGAFNTRIEAWSIWRGMETNPPSSPWSQSTGTDYNDTCGSSWVDSHVNMGGLILDTGRRYRVTVHADDTQAVTYLVDRRTGGGAWQQHTAAVWKNVSYATNWLYGKYGTFSDTANGVGFLISPSSNLPASGSWFVTVSSFGSGWF